jgi:sugar transferase (PEP-CTERM/EpsH1 system associated)
MSHPDLLYLVHRIPYPPNKGDKIRSYHMLRYLSERYRVHLGTFIDDVDDWRYLDEVKKLCADVCAVKLDTHRQRLTSLSALLRGEAMSIPYYRSAELEDWVRSKLSEQGISRVLVFSSPMAQYLPSNRVALRKVVDFVDVDSEKWRQYAARRPWPMSWIYRREGERLLNFEKRVASSADFSLFVTRDEAELFRRRGGEGVGAVKYVSNGVDTEYFSPERAYENPYESTGPVLVFTGMMDYWANVDAVAWFARDVLPIVQESVATAQFVIVGARPTPEVERLDALEGVTVTGSVPDVRPYVAHAEVSVAPLRIARGIQNKVLEAMAMAKPLVATSAALEGLDFPPCDSRDGADGFADAVVRFLRSRHARDEAGAAGRAWVREHHDWSQTLKPVAGLIENEVVHASA